MHSDTAAILLMGNFKEAGWSENHPSEFFFQDMIVFSHKLSSIKENFQKYCLHFCTELFLLRRFIQFKNGNNHPALINDLKIY